MIKYIEIDSSRRDRFKGKPGNFLVKTLTETRKNQTTHIVNPVSDNVSIVKWRCSEFMISGAGVIKTKGIHLSPYNQTILPSDTTSFSASEGETMILTSITNTADSTGFGGLQPHDNYYYGATIQVDNPQQSARILEYKYVSSNKCFIRVDSSIVVKSSSNVKILDPSLIPNSTLDPRDTPYIFVPYGPPTHGFSDFKLINITQNTEHEIEYHDTRHNLIRIKNNYTTKIEDTDKLEIRKTIPHSISRSEMTLFNDYLNSVTFNSSYNTIGLDVEKYYSKLSDVYANDCVEIQRDDLVYSSVTPVGSDNTQIDLNASVSGASQELNAYNDCTVRFNLSNKTIPYDYTSEDRKVIGYSGGVSSLTLPALSLRSLTYTDAPTVTITSPSGSGGKTATATAHLPAFVLKAFTITSGGSGYTSAPTVTISDPTGDGTKIVATATALLTAGVVTGFKITDRGRGYITAPTVTITGGGGAGATATAAIYDGSLTNASVTAGGSEYPNTPTSSISAVVDAPHHPNGTRAEVSLTVAGNQVTAISITNAGSGYTSVPNITINTTRGQGASLAIELTAASAGSVEVSWLEIVNAGSGYTSNPTVTISGAETATAAYSNSILTVDKPFDNITSGYTGTLNVNIFSPTESRVISKVERRSLGRFTQPTDVTGTVISLIDYGGGIVPSSYSLPESSWSYPQSTDKDADINKNGHLKGMFVAIKYASSPDAYHYGYITDHIVSGSSSTLPLYNYLKVDSQFQTYMGLYPGEEIKIASIRTKEVFKRNPYSRLPLSQGERLSILSLTKDSHSEILKDPERWGCNNSNIIYNISLVNLSLPNIPLKSGKGGYITEYPYIYVKFYNNETDNLGGGVQSSGSLHSNNPDINNNTFRVVIDNTVDDRVTKFVSLRSGDMIQSKQIHMNKSLEFGVFLPDGSVFETLQQDDSPPRIPKPDLQISALFELTPVEDCLK